MRATSGITDCALKADMTSDAIWPDEKSRRDESFDWDTRCSVGGISSLAVSNLNPSLSRVRTHSL